MKRIKIGYFADGPWSHEALKRLLLDQSLQIVFICARSDAPDPILRVMAADNLVDFITHPQINSSEFLNLIIGYDCDLFVSMSFNQIFKSKIINLPSLKTINCHAGKLPFYRGRNILNWALINDEKEFGITVHYVDEGIDTGDIILQKCYPITDEDNYQTLLERAYEGCATNLYDAIKIIQRGNVKVLSQKDIDRLGFYCTARIKGDERLNWNQKSRDIFNFIRAISIPGPQARTYIGDVEIKINKAEFLPYATCYKGVVGSVVGVDGEGFFVKTLDSFIRVVDWSGYPKPRIGDRLK